MKWRTPSPSDPEIALARPLLDLPKAALVAYAAECDVPYREDASNATLDFRRNRIRHELLPLLRRKYQPALDKTILRVMDIVGADADFAAQAAREWLGAGEIRNPKSEIRYAYCAGRGTKDQVGRVRRITAGGAAAVRAVAVVESGHRAGV